MFYKPIAGIVGGKSKTGERVTLSRRHADLLEARGLDIELLETLGLQSCEDRGPDWIAIPYFAGGNIVGTKYRTVAGQKEFSQAPGSAQILYNRDCLSDQTLANLPIVICEGEVDCWTALQCGFPRAVSVPAGAPNTEVGDRASAKYQFIDDMPELPDDTVFILAVDGDAPGSALRADLELRLKRRRCKWVRYPRGCKDLNDALQRYGQRGVVETLNRAQWVVGNVYRMADIPPVPEPKAYDSQFPGLRDHYKLRLGDFSVVTGVPSHGKSTVVNDLCCRMAMFHQWPICLASFEQSQHDMRRKLRTWHGAMPVNAMDAETIDHADKWINNYFSFVVPDDDSCPTLDWALERFTAATLRFGARMIVLDPWNELEHDRPDGMSLTEYVGKALREFKAFARKYEVHFVVVAHPAKMRRDNEGKYPIPTLYDISDSAHWYNKADVGIVVHRDGDVTTVRVGKSRYHDQIGTPGETKVRYVWERAAFVAAE